MKGQLEAWENEYASPDPLWKGPPPQVGHCGRRVLELGCGNGKTLAAVARAELSVGLDHSFNALRRCPPGKASLVRGDVLGLPFQDGSFDTVLLFHVLEHLLEEERVAAVKEVIRVLGPGGLVSVRSFSVRDMRYGKGTEVEKDTFRRGNSIIYHYFEPDEVRSLMRPLEEIDLREVAVEKRYVKKAVRAELVATFRNGRP